MKRNILNSILITIITLLILIIIGGTMVSVLIKRNEPKVSIEIKNPTEKEIESLNKRNSKQVSAYTGLGQLRILTSPDYEKENDIGKTLILSPWFTYPENDTVFYEELARKKNLTIGIITNYFSTKTQQQILKTTEEKIKADLLSLINSQLSLGQIIDVYFTDYLFLN